MQDSAVTTARSRIVRVGVLSAITKLDLREAIDSISGMVLGQIYDAPYSVVTSPAGEPQAQPLLFEPLRAEGKLKFSAAIRPGVKFSDGTPLTADLAARSLRGAKVLASKAKIDVEGDRVVFTLTEPNPRFDLALTQAVTSIVLDRPMQLLGTGAFMFEQRPNLRTLQTATSFRLVPNPHYAGKRGVDEIEFRVYPAAEDGTPRALIDALRAGEVDLTTALTMADVTANQLTGMALSLQPGNSTGVLFYNCQRPALAKAEVRRGLSLALDLHDLATRSFDKNPAAFLAPNLLPPMMGRPSGFPVLDRREANRLLDASGAKPKRLSLLVPWAPRPYMPKPLPLAQAVQRQLAEVGVTVDLREPKTSEQFFDDLVRGNYDMALAGWIADTPDPADFFETLLWSKMCEGERHSNLSRWKSPVMDAALARFREQPTEEHKKAINQIIRDEAPLLPLIYGQSVVVHSRKIKNVSMSATGVLPLSAVTVS